MQATLAIVRLTLKAAFRFRLVPLLALVLIGGVFLLPAVIKDDGTARGLTQIVLTYTLGLITAVLGLTTLWLACGTLARDIDDATIQVVAVKPVARWQIWLGKWLGILLLDVLLLGLAAGIVYGQMQWRARQLTAEQQEVLRNEVFVARASIKPERPDYAPEVERRLEERVKSGAAAGLGAVELRKLLTEQVKAELQVVPPAWTRVWKLDLRAVKDAVRDRPLYLRVKFFAAEKTASGNYAGVWDVGPAESPKRGRIMLSQAAETFHEITLPPNLLNEAGVLQVEFRNANDVALLFPLEDGLEVLYREGGFGFNYLRGLTIVVCWLALLAAVGLWAASFLAFPVAAFVSLSLLILAFSTGTMRQVVDQGTLREVDHDTGLVGEATLFDHATVGIFRGALATVNLVRDFSPVEALSTGRYIGWDTVAKAVGQIVLLVGGLFAVSGIVIFTRRELATAQNQT